MKKLIYLLLATTTIAFAQDKTKDTTASIKEGTLSLTSNFSDPSSFGLSFEGQAKESIFKNRFTSGLIYINYAMTTLDGGYLNRTVNGTGYEVGLGTRNYISKNTNFPMKIKE